TIWLPIGTVLQPHHSFADLLMARRPFGYFGNCRVTSNIHGGPSAHGRKSFIQTCKNVGVIGALVAARDRVKFRSQGFKASKPPFIGGRLWWWWWSWWVAPAVTTAAVVAPTGTDTATDALAARGARRRHGVRTAVNHRRARDRRPPLRLGLGQRAPESALHTHCPAVPYQQPAPHTAAAATRPALEFAHRLLFALRSRRNRIQHSHGGPPSLENRA